MSRTPSSLGSRIIRAGAGAGKTTRLISEVQSFAEDFHRREGRWPRLVLTTFTIKATQELRERLFLRATQAQSVTPASSAPDVMEFILSPQNLMITTIHGVLTQFLRRNAETIGWDPQFRLIDEAEDLRAAKTLLAEIVFAAQSEHIGLTEEVHFSGLLNLMVTYSRAMHTHEEFSPVAIRVFEAEAARMRERLLECCSAFIKLAEEQPLPESWLLAVGTTREIAARVASSAIWQDVWSFLSSSNLDLRKPRPSRKFSAPAEMEHLLERLIAQVKELASEVWSPAHWGKVEYNTNRLQTLGTLFSQKFWELKRATGRLALGDLEPLAFFLARQAPDCARRFANDWDYWLIDEYQDTSPLQNQLLDLFTDGARVFYVGDPQQSIYYFRGARSEVFNDRFDSSETRGLAREELRANYRSTPALMSFFNAFFQSGPVPFKTLVPGRTDEGEQNLPVATFFKCADDACETHAAVDHIRGLVEGDAPLDSIAVIARTNDDLNRIAILLTHHGVPTHVHASSQFAIRREILDLRSLCAFLVNPNDDEAAVTVFRSPWFHVEDSILAEVVRSRQSLEFHRRRSLWEHLQESTEHPQVLRLENSFKKMKTQGLSATIGDLLRESGIVDVSHVYDSTGQREANLWKFVLLLKEAEHTPGFSAVEFLHQWDRERTALAEEGDAVAALEPNRVNLMTIHASKGLQFNHVIVPYLSRPPRLSNSNFLEMNTRGHWSTKARGEDGDLVGTPFHLQVLEERRFAELEESDRLLYVAATRAKESIAFTLLSEPKENSWHGRFRWNYETGEHTEEGFSYRVLEFAPCEETVVPARGAPLHADPPRTARSSTVRARFVMPPTHDRLTRRSASLMSQPKDPAAPENSQRSRPHRLPRGFLLGPVKGLMFHQKMERLQKFLMHSGNDALPPMAADPEVRWVLDLTEVPMREILKKGFAEWPFQTVSGSNLIIGQIDLWAEVDSLGRQELWVVDYKTGASKNFQKAFDQLQVYGWALKRFRPDSQIRLVALFPGEQKIFIKDFDPAYANTLISASSGTQTLHSQVDQS